MKKWQIISGGVIIIGVVVIGIVMHHRPDKPALTSAPRGLYVAMGDSVAAGVGLKTDSDSSACDRTNESYPHQIATSLNYKLTNLACSGATLPAGILGEQDVNDLFVSAQLNQLFAQPRPSLITMTIGANDVGWTSILSECYTTECGSATDNSVVATRLSTLSTNLHAALDAIRNHYGANTVHVYITGYHQVFPTNPSTTCVDLTGIDASELAWGRTLQQDINTTISNVATSYPFATFVPINFSGHELCTADPWIQSLSDTYPYHPTQAGQTAFAHQILQTIKTHR